MLKKIYISLFLTVATFISCTENEHLLDGQDSTCLDIDVAVGSRSSRSLVNNMQDGDNIGLLLVDGSGSSYDGKSYMNVMATADVTGGVTDWTIERDVTLVDTEGRVYAYYPYNNDVDDFTAIPVETVSQTDYMYGMSSDAVSSNQPKADIMLNHALAATRISLKRGTYTGTGVVSSMAVKGDKLATSAVLNALDGSLSSISGTGADITVAMDNASLDSNVSGEIIFVPVSVTDGAAIDIAVVIDGHEYTYEHAVGALSQGTVYNYSLTMDETGLSMADISIGDWGYTSDGYPAIKTGEHTVTFSGNIDGIAFNNTVADDGTVTVIAVPVEEGRWVEEVSVDGSTVLSQTLDEDTGTRTIVLSDVSSDETLNFVGAWYPIHVTGDTDFLSYTLKRSADGTAVITATPEDSDDWVAEVSGSGSGDMTQDYNSTTGVRVIRVKGQTEPYTLNMCGVESEWLIATYNITKTGSQRIFAVSNSQYGPTFTVSKISKMKVDGVEVTPALDFDFTTTGLHVVKVKLSNKYNIPDYMFARVSILVGVRFPVGIEQILTNAFEGCSGLTGPLVIPNSVFSIGKAAFNECPGLTSLTLPNSVAGIGEGAFFYCRGLTGELIIPNSVTKINNQTFTDCKFSKIVIPESVTEIGNSAFSGCSSWVDELVIPNSVISIGERAFEGCKGLTSIYIPKTVSTIDGNSFYNCSGLTSIVVEDDNTVYDSRDNCNAIMNSATNELISGCVNTVIPDDTEAIGDNAFYGCTGFTDVTIPHSVKSIGQSAFAGCSNLTSIFIPNSVTSIGLCAFWHCLKLEKITCLATTEPSIHYRTFEDIKRLGKLIVPIGCISAYDNWMHTNSHYLGYYNWTCVEAPEFIPIKCVSLSITAEDAYKNSTSTLINYTAICSGYDGTTGEFISDRAISGVARSDNFGQNPSATDSREVVVSYSYMGVTASTTITQSANNGIYYAVDLNGEWQNSSVTNPNASLYDGVYESFSNYNVHDSGATMTIRVMGYDTFTIYIRSYAESSFDYVMASQLDQSITNSTSYSNTTLVKSHTRGSQNSGITIGSYKAVTYDIPDDGQVHIITIIYRKDGSSNSGDDRGYLLIGRNNGSSQGGASGGS